MTKEMFGVELHELVSFFRQLGLALAGGASLWGMVLALRHRGHDGEGEKCFICQWTARRLLMLLFSAAAIALIAWSVFVSLLAGAASAHEGIVIVPTIGEKLAALSGFLPLAIAWAIFLFAGIIAKKSSPIFFQKYLAAFYGINFAVVFTLISFPAWTGAFDKAQWFHIGHGFHSILTLGTVLTLDFLFIISSRPSPILKQHIYPLFPTLSKVIWVGLGIDFLSVALVFGDALALTPKFFFMQTVVGIIIMNGALLSGPITKKLLDSVKEGGKEISKRWWAVASVCGAVSITSWTTITFVDMFANLTLGYGEMLAIYLSVIVFIIIGHRAFERYEKNRDPRAVYHGVMA